MTEPSDACGTGAADAVGAEEFESALSMLGDASTVLAAVSGGPDSTALMHALARWSCEPGRPSIRVASVDHGLRAGSRAEAEAVATAASRLGLPHEILTWTGRRSGPVSQDAARRARYRLLVAHAKALGADVLATAHTLDDQAETILMRMAAGSGVAGLAGMAPSALRDGIRLRRPFLGLAKARLVATCRRNGWDFSEDPSNADPRYARARWRTLLPRLAAEGLDAASLSRLSRRAARAEVALAALSRAAFDRIAASRRDLALGDLVVLKADRLAAEPDEIALRVLALGLAGASPGEESPRPIRLERLEACLAGLLRSHREGRPMRRTIAGRLVALGRDGNVTIAAEPPRRRGRLLHMALPRTTSAGDDARAD